MAGRPNSRSRSRKSSIRTQPNHPTIEENLNQMTDEVKELRSQLADAQKSISQLQETMQQHSDAAVAVNQVIRNVYHNIEQQQIIHREHWSILDRRRALVTQSTFALATTLRENGFLNHEQWQNVIDILVPPQIIQVELF